MVIALSKDSVSPVVSAAASRDTKSQQLNFIVALRAVAAVVIVWHHFALYPPLNDWTRPLLGDVLTWFEVHARSTQVFFVLAGFVLAQTLVTRRWQLGGLLLFLLRRYCRLGLPYLAVIALVLPVYAFARNWVPASVLGSPVSWPQFIAHLFFLQDILGYEALSAGLWFVCINIQLCILFALLICVRDSSLGRHLDVIGLGGWALAAFSLFYANLAPGWDVWAVYFFPYFFMGVIVWRRVHGRQKLEFYAYQALFLLAMLFEWRWRLGVAMVVGALLVWSLESGFAARWPRQAALLWLGRVSYSLFLVHFPVLVFVAALWSHLEWTSPPLATLGLVVAFFASLALAGIFYRWIEAPSARAARQIGRTWRQSALALADSR